MKKIETSPMQTNFINKVIDLAKEDDEIMELFVNKSSGLTWALNAIDVVVNWQYKGMFEFLKKNKSKIYMEKLKAQKASDLTKRISDLTKAIEMHKDDRIEFKTGETEPLIINQGSDLYKAIINELKREKKLKEIELEKL